jgi:hypothetical protein
MSSYGVVDMMTTMRGSDWLVQVRCLAFCFEIPQIELSHDIARKHLVYSSSAYYKLLSMLLVPLLDIYDDKCTLMCKLV